MRRMTTAGEARRIVDALVLARAQLPDEVVLGCGWTVGDGTIFFALEDPPGQVARVAVDGSVRGANVAEMYGNYSAADRREFGLWPDAPDDELVEPL